MNNKSILILGGPGTLGKALTRYIVENYKPQRIRIMSRCEYKQFRMKEEFAEHVNISYILGDIRDAERVEMACREIDIVINCAAMKRIESCQKDPLECKKTNVDGVENIIQAAFKCGVKKVFQISTDKAVYATTLYGKSKAMAEDLVMDANWYSTAKHPMFSCGRFGNFIGSTGSVVEIFKRQAETGVLTVTHPDMVRYFIDPAEVAVHVCRWISKMKGGEIFIPKMKEVRVMDLATAIGDGAEIKFIGLREMEKITEVLHSTEEEPIMQEEEDYYVIRPNQVN
jgi:UDP-N-acetylglucosamine 4,6-dehydratase/5-epimerase